MLLTGNTRQYAKDAMQLNAHGEVEVPATYPPRERILMATRALFYRHGIHAVGVEAIAAAAQTNKMTLYRHFGSKDALIAAYVTQLADEGDAKWQGFVSAHPGNPDGQIAAWLDYVEQVLNQSDARGCAIANAAVELPPGHEARQIIEAYKLRKRDRLKTLFRNAGYADPEGLADEVFLMFEGAQISLQCAGKSGPSCRLAHVVRALLAEAPRRAQGTAPV